MIGFGGRRVVITGAGGGVGRVLVQTFASLGAKVVACDIEGAQLPADGIAERLVFDLLDDEAVDDAAKKVIAGGAPAIVVANAGWTRAETLAEVDDEALRLEMDLNFRGTARLTQALMPAMRGQPEGAAFVFVSSVNAGSHFGNPVYAAAKAALLVWMRAIATEEGKNGIRANAVQPGSIRTPAWAHRLALDPDLMDKIGALYPLGRLVQPEEVANAVAFLASPAASGITGAVLPVDAGISAGNLPFLNQIAGG